MVASSPPARPRFLQVVIPTILGGALRFKSFGRLGPSHSVEGSFAVSGAWTIAPGGLSELDPMVIPNAPPGVPILVDLAQGCFIICDGSPIVDSILSYVAAIPDVAWLAPCTPGAGADSNEAALVTPTLRLVALSRDASYDAPSPLAWLVPIGLGGRFLERPGLGRALALGLAVGFAQKLKLNGWLAGTHVLVTALLGLAVRREGALRGAALCRSECGGSAALIAALLDWPWFDFVERHGGYSALMSHRRGSLGGTSVWWIHWNHQFTSSGVAHWRLSTWTGIVPTGAVDLQGPRLVPARGWRSWFGLFLVLSVLKSLYHPYARLWRLMHSCGGLLLADLLVRTPPFAAPVQGTREGPSAPVVGTSGRIGRSVALICLAMPRLRDWANPLYLLPSDRVLDPEPTLRRIVRHDLRRNPRRRATIRILLRRPVLFHLLVEQHTAMRLEPGWESVVSKTSHTEVLQLNEAMFGEGSSASRMLDERVPYGKAERDFPDQPEPVTRLDAHPCAANLHLWSPSRGNRLHLLTA